MSLAHESFIFSGSLHGDSALKMSAKRYTYALSDRNTHGLTLIFAHGIGSHKEHWEPVLQHIFQLQNSKGESYRIREAWSFDWQNHGDSAVLNYAALKAQKPGVSIYEWTPAITAFIRSPRMKDHRIVPLGHSAGASAMILTTKYFPVGKYPFVALILVEPALISEELFNFYLNDRMAIMNFSVATTKARRDTWPSRDAAFEYFIKRSPWKGWDPRMVHLLCEHGLIENADGSVALKCDKVQEAVSYPDKEPHFEAVRQVGHICHSVPLHIIWGTKCDFMPLSLQDALCDAAEGRIAASVARIAGAGHQILQEKPDQLALKIADALDTISVHATEQAKL